MPRVFIGIGSNIDPERNITEALRKMGEAAKILGISTCYKTPSLGKADSPDFINAAVLIETDLPPRDLKFRVLRQIENDLGRARTQDKYSPRTIDLDIMVYGNAVIEEPDLLIPDPDIYTRPFAAGPIAELDPDLVLPDSGERIADIARSLGKDRMRALDDFTAALRKEILK